MLTDTQHSALTTLPICLLTTPGFGSTEDTGASFPSTKELDPSIAQIRKLLSHGVQSLKSGIQSSQ